MKNTSTKKGDSGATKDTLKARDDLFPEARVNTHRSRLQWEEYAAKAGYKTLKEMLYLRYVTMGLTTRELGANIGTSKDRATQLLRECGIPLRKRGGVRA